MKKNKDGQVMASSTELKNKTGDILALVDKFGEVVLTAYNKPRYKIVKIDVTSFIDLNDSQPAKSQRASKKSTPKVVSQELKKETVTVAVQNEQKGALAKDTIDITPWDRDNVSERAFTANATKVMIS